MELADLSIAGVGAVPLVLALTQLVKQYVDTKYAPLVSIAVGVVVAALSQGFTVDSLFVGLMIGLSASGLWSGVRTVAK